MDLPTRRISQLVEKRDQTQLDSVAHQIFTIYLHEGRRLALIVRSNTTHLPSLSLRLVEGRWTVLEPVTNGALMQDAHAWVKSIGRSTYFHSNTIQSHPL